MQPSLNVAKTPTLERTSPLLAEYVLRLAESILQLAMENLVSQRDLMGEGKKNECPYSPATSGNISRSAIGMHMGYEAILFSEVVN